MSELLGVLFAVLVVTALIPKMVDAQRISSDNSRLTTTAQQQIKINAAASVYVREYASSLQAAASPTNPAIITIQMLQATKMLGAEFSGVNPYGQTWQIQALQPSPENLKVLVTTLNGDALTDVQATKVAAIVGSDGGFIPKNDSGLYPSGSATAYGAYGSWSTPTANYISIAGGRPASVLSFNKGQLTSNYLYRNAVPSQPQLNQMNTSIDMTGNSVNNAGNVNTTNVYATNTTSTTGTISTLDSDNFRATNATINALSANQVAASSIVMPNDSALKIGRTSLSGENGNTVLRQDGSIYLQNHASGSTDIAQVGNISSLGIVAAKQLRVDDIVTAGQYCPQNGLIAKDYAGTLMNCQEAIWKQVGSSARVNLVQNGYSMESSGLIYQWGFTTTRGDNSSTCYNFPFPNRAFFVTVQSVGRQAHGSNGHDYIGTYGTSCFTYTSEPNASGITWFAVGY